MSNQTETKMDTKTADGATVPAQVATVAHPAKKKSTKRKVIGEAYVLRAGAPRLEYIPKDKFITEVKDGKKETTLDLKYLQSVVGGPIEIIDLTPVCSLVVNEEGRLKGLPINRKATAKAKQHGLDITILGDVLVAPSCVL